MKKIKPKQIAAIVAIVLLVGMYIATLVIAIVDKSNALRMFYGCLIMTVFIPILLWIFIAMYQFVTRNRKDNQEASKASGPVSINGESSVDTEIVDTNDESK